jgi:glucose-1-phosphate cytidylyltransferase
VKVVILCGGQGTRIRDVTDSVPKPMITLDNYPILWHIMKYYSHWGHNEFILCLGYKGQIIKDFFLNYKAHTEDFTIDLGNPSAVKYHNNHPEANWQITLAETGQNTLTGSRIRNIKGYVADEENFMLTYGDGLSNININELLKFHNSHGKILTVSGVQPPGRFGELVHTAKGQVIEFNEKPQVSGGRISGGYFVCRKEIFNYLNSGRDDIVFEQEPMRRLVQDQQMMVYAHDDFWQPMDTYRDYAYLNDLVAQRAAPWIKW